jgi:hypothetical protein
MGCECVHRSGVEVSRERLAMLLEVNFDVFAKVVDALLHRLLNHAQFALHSRPRLLPGNPTETGQNPTEISAVEDCDPA